MLTIHITFMKFLVIDIVQHVEVNMSQKSWTDELHFV